MKAKKRPSRKGDYAEYWIDPELFKRVRAFYYGEMFNRRDGGKVKIYVTGSRAKFIELTFGTKLEKIKTDEK